MVVQQTFNFIEVQPTQPEFKNCTHCKQAYPQHFFIKNTSICKHCKSERNKAYRDRLKQATPPNMHPNFKKAIDHIYTAVKLCSSVYDDVDFEVDHIYSLGNENSCGVHYPWNLQIVRSVENKQKKNKNGLISEVLK